MRLLTVRPRTEQVVLRCLEIQDIDRPVGVDVVHGARCLHALKHVVLDFLQIDNIDAVVGVNIPRSCEYPNVAVTPDGQSAARASHLIDPDRYTRVRIKGHIHNELIAERRDVQT